MIVDTISSKYAYYAEKMGFQKWQIALFENLLDWHTLLHTDKFKVKIDQHIIKSINMGPQSGHTYFARAAANKSFPIKTKVYATSLMHLGEYADLILKPDRCHQMVDILHRIDFVGYHWDDPVDLVIVDMARNNVGEYRQALSVLQESLPLTTSILLLQVGNKF